MKKWIEEHQILVWVISSIVFAFVIHCLFSKIATNEWYAAKWGAGDILTYASTVALGLLAVWQNKKFKQENDVSQERMEKLTHKANELALISKVIELESTNISRLKEKNKDYIDACNIEKASLEISDVALYPDDFRKTYIKIKMDNRCANIRLWSLELLYALAVYDSDPDIAELSKLLTEHTEYSHKVIQEIRIGLVPSETFKCKQELEKKFTVTMFDFISKREKKLNSIIYGDFSFDQIKVMYANNANKD